MERKNQAWGALLPGLFTLATLGTANQAAQAQFGSQKVAAVKATAPKTVTPGKEFTLTIEVKVEPSYHIQGNPTKEGYVATTVELGTVKGFTVGKVTYPAAHEEEIGGEKLPIYNGTVKFNVPVTPVKTLKPGKFTLPVTVKYQACNDQACLPPTKAETSAVVNIAGSTSVKPKK